MPTFQPTGEPSAGPWQVEPLQVFVQRLTNGFSGLQRPIIIAIDGRSASGKTTLATLISEVVPGSAAGAYRRHALERQLVQPHRTSAPVFFRLDGNSFSTMCSSPAYAREPVRYRPPAWEDWGRGKGAVEVPTGCSLLILEGVGAARRELMHVLDRVVWVQADLERAGTRGIIRDGGDAGAVSLWDSWMAEEFPFLAEQRPWERADVIVSGTPDLEHDPFSQVVTSARDTHLG